MQLHDELSALIEASGAECVAVAFQDLETGRTMLINSDVSFHPASTFKICVMMELYRQARLGRFTLDMPLLIKKEFASIVEGQPFSLREEDDSEQSLYHRLGTWDSLREINRLMIVQSSNLATNLLIELLGASNVTAFMSALGAPDLHVLRGPEDNRAYSRGWNNVATARGLMQILCQLARGNVVSSEASQEMIDVLRGQRFNEGIPRGLPAGADVAHKTGWNDRLYHDAAVVFPPGRAPFVLVVLTRGLPEHDVAPQLAASVARLLSASLLSHPL